LFNNTDIGFDRSFVISKIYPLSESKAFK